MLLGALLKYLPTRFEDISLRVDVPKQFEVIYKQKMLEIENISF